MFLLSSLIVILLDQLSKIWAMYQGWSVVNRGVSFGWLQHLSPGLLNLGLIGLVIFLAANYRRSWQAHPWWSGVFWGGVVANLLDRVLLGGVVDWLSLPFLKFQNNLADCAIVLGLLGLVLQQLRHWKKHHAAAV